MWLTSCRNHQKAILGEWVLEDISVVPGSHLSDGEKRALIKDFIGNKSAILAISGFSFTADSNYIFEIAGSVSEGKYYFIPGSNKMVVTVTNNPEYRNLTDTFTVAMRGNNKIGLSQSAPFGKLLLYLRKK